jgi:hypothetical protein
MARARVAAAGTTNATSVKATAGTLKGWYLFNSATSLRYVKFYDKASAPTVGTDTPAFTLPLPASSGSNVRLPIDFLVGIAYAITGAVADNDTTAVSANDVHGVLTYE